MARERANPHTAKKPLDKGIPPTASALFSGTCEPKYDTQSTYCQQSHMSSSCPTVLQVEARKTILRNSGRCFNCLCKGHISCMCRSQSRCQKCKGKHHSSICDSTGKCPSLVNSALNSDTPPFQPGHTTATVCSSQSYVVFLQTAWAVIQDPTNPSASLGVRLLLGGGSQRSYLSEWA